jgi:NTP pyrophosphatase (non-canonical NTP hydrolase)
MPARTDTNTTVADLRRAVAGFVDDRDWQPFHSPKNLSMSIAIEAAELMEHFQWLTAEEARLAAGDADEQAAVGGELADIVIYCLSLGNALDLDITTAVLSKLRVNERRFPAGEFRGRFRRPERPSGREATSDQAAGRDAPSHG